MTEPTDSIFDQRYRVVAVHGDRLVLKGLRSGEIISMINADPDVPIHVADYPVVKLIALTDPSCAPQN